jgi:hypothetical protein
VLQIDPGEIVCVLTLPDVTLRLARAACKRVHVRRPGLPLLVMPWLAAVDPAEWRYRALAEATSGVATNTSELTLFVGRIRQGLRTEQQAPSGPGEDAELRPATS